MRGVSRGFHEDCYNEHHLQPRNTDLQSGSLYGPQPPDVDTAYLNQLEVVVHERVKGESSVFHTTHKSSIQPELNVQATLSHHHTFAGELQERES